MRSAHRQKFSRSLSEHPNPHADTVTCKLSRVVPKCAEFHGLDISSEMIKRSQAAIASVPAPCAKCQFHSLRESKLPAILQGRLDFCYAFDCLPHCDAHTIYAYLVEFCRVLKPGAHALVHTSNLCAPGYDSLPS